MPKEMHAAAREMARRIQHTLLGNCITRAAWELHVAACAEYGFHAAMVPSPWVRGTVDALAGTGVRVASWIDLPLGTCSSGGKADEARRLVDAGVEEIDMMPNVGFLVSGMEREYFADIHGVVAAAGGRPVKVISEMLLLDDRQLERAVALASEAGVSYIKNNSGSALGPSTPEQIRKLRALAPPHVLVKASGGIRTAALVRELVAAGASLFGTSRGTAIVDEVIASGATAPQGEPKPAGVAY